MTKPEFDSQSIKIERAVPDDAEIICDIRDRAWLKAYPNAELGITADDIRVNAKGRDGEFVPRRIAYLKEQFAKDDGTGLNLTNLAIIGHNGQSGLNYALALGRKK